MHTKYFTGERLETFINTEVALEHLHRYAIALQFTGNKKVLDIASGEGYGSNLLATTANEVVGVDISLVTIQAAQKKYKKSNLKFKHGSASEIPLSDDYFDVAVSFETIEHHDKHDEMMVEIKRVLKPGGLFIISSPDKRYYTDKRQFFNEFHVKELYEEEFKHLIRANFIKSNFYKQRATFASFLIPEGNPKSFKEYSGDYDSIKENTDFEQMYVLAFASDEEVPDISLTVFTDNALMSRLDGYTISKVRKTVSYTIGHLILWPFKALREIIS